MPPTPQVVSKEGNVEYEDESVALEEIRKQEEAQSWVMPDRPLLPEDLGISVAMPPTTRESTGKNAQTLEELYDLYPKIGNGEWKLRVTRIGPSSFNGVNIAGVIHDVLDRLSMDDFRDRYGGGSYDVKVMSPIRNGGGNADYRPLKGVRFRVPGEPNMSSVEDTMMQQTRLVGDAPSVRIKEIDSHDKLLAEERRERRELQNQISSMNQAPTGALEHFRDASRMAVEEVKSQSETTIKMWESEVERLRGELRVKDAELVDTRRSLMAAELKASDTMARIETQSMRDQKERHEQEVKRIEEHYRSRLGDLEKQAGERYDALQDKQSKELAALTAKVSDERQRYEEIQRLERERVREDSKTRVEQIDRQMAQQFQALREDYSRRVDDLKNSTDREIAATRERADREISAIRESSETRTVLIEQMANSRVALAEAEAQRARREADENKRQSEEWRAKTYKTPLEAMVEAKELASLTGMIEPGDAKPEEGAPSTAQQLLGLAKNVIDNAPKILEQMSQSRAQEAEQARRMMASQQMVEPQYPGMVRGQLQQPQPRRAPQMGPRQPGPPQMARQGRPMPAVAMQQMGPPAVAMQQMGPPAVAMPMGEASGMVVTSNMPPVSGYVNVPTSVSPVQPYEPPPSVPQQTQVPVETTDQSALQPAPQPAPMSAEQEAEKARAQQIGIFFDRLEQAVQTRAVTPRQFAEQFIEAVGTETSSMLLGQFAPDDIIQAIKSSPGGESTSVVTRDGQKFVNELWTEAGKLLGLQGATSAPGGTQPS